MNDTRDLVVAALHKQAKRYTKTQLVQYLQRLRGEYAKVLEPTISDSKQITNIVFNMFTNGYNDFVNNCELSDFEDITISTSASSPTEMPYDGYIYLKGSTKINEGVSKLYVNGIIVAQFESSDWVANSLYTNFKKGDKIYTSGWYVLTTPQKVRYYKLRDYTSR